MLTWNLSEASDREAIHQRIGTPERDPRELLNWLPGQIGL
jgi:hypothetical protein